MLSGLVRLVLYRFLGARVMLGLAVFGWLRRLLGGRRDKGRRAAGTGARGGGASGAVSGAPGGTASGARKGSAYQPSQGSSQTAHREPR
jgi:hypothetical protein